MIPDTKNPLWADLIKGKINPDLSSFSLKMKLNSVRQYYQSGNIDLNDAIEDLHALCVKYEKIYIDDIQKILQTNNISL
jgi:hypothetical protein